MHTESRKVTSDSKQSKDDDNISNEVIFTCLTNAIKHKQFHNKQDIRRKLIEDIDKINILLNDFVPADKIINIYHLEAEENNNLVKESN